jgi:hypothetical protein
MPTKPAEIEPENGSGPGPLDDRRSAESSHANPIARASTSIGGYIARQPALLKLLEWLGWHNPGGSVNP